MYLVLGGLFNKIINQEEDEKATPAGELRCSKISNQIDEAPIEEPEPGSWAVAMFWDGKKRVGRSFPINRNYLSIFGSLYDEDGMCLHSFSDLSDACRSTVRLGKYCDDIWSIVLSNSYLKLNAALHCGEARKVSGFTIEIIE